MRREGPLGAPFALGIAAQVARAMALAESQGLVHRDLKPANLMLVSGPDLMVKVIDFGLVKAAAASESDITHGGFVGTPAKTRGRRRHLRLAIDPPLDRARDCRTARLHAGGVDPFNCPIQDDGQPRRRSSYSDQMINARLRFRIGRAEI